MLIADHMPMPGAATNLALAFGVVFHDGYAYNADSTHFMVFSRESGRLADHIVTRAEGGGAVPFVLTSTGQAFRTLPEVVAHPILLLPDGSCVLLPNRAWDFDKNAPRIPGAGLSQGTLTEVGTLPAGATATPLRGGLPLNLNNGGDTIILVDQE